MENLKPYLMFNGDCEDAVNFYKKCFADQMDSAESSKTANSSIQLSLGFEDPLKMEKTFNCLKQAGLVTMELKEQFWGEKFCMLTDKFGIKWMFNCPKKESA